MMAKHCERRRRGVLTKQQIRCCLDVMADMFPNAHCELVHRNPFELLIAVVLSAQCTDALVNKVTKHLFEKYRTPYDYIAVPLEELEQDIRSIGLYRNKAKNIQKLCAMLLEKYNGEVPRDRDELMKLPGVGRKTANVVASVAFGVPAIAVDTHVERVSKRLGFCRWDASVLEVEQTLMKTIPKEEWSITHHRMIFFGRYHCKAQAPQCPVCPLLHLCREGKKRMRKRENERARAD
jgi:endonuclease-3